MSVVLRSDKPVLVHRLAAVLRFRDAFTGSPVQSPLAVSIPSLRWTAMRSQPDATYRFLVTNRSLPSSPPGGFDVAVESLSGEYVNHEPFQVQVPSPTLPHPPPLRTSDFLVERTLWPTRRFRPLPGETAVVGRIESATGARIEGLQITLFNVPGPPPPNAPYTRSDSHGDFFFRLPQLKGAVSGTTVIAEMEMGIELRDESNNVIAATPAEFQVKLGRVSVVQFSIP